MFTFPQFVDEVSATLRRALGSTTATIRMTEINGEEVDWERGDDAIRVVRHSDVGVMVSPYHGGRRRGAMRVVPMDQFGVDDVCALIVEHVAGADPTEIHF